jgi:hypothetical protein
MLRTFCLLFLILIPLLLFGQTQEDIEEALNQIAPPLGGVVNDAVLQNANTLGGLPHFRITGGVNLRTVKFTDPNDPNNNVEWTAGAINVEGRVGLFPGKSLAPTIGGFGSTDLLLRMAFYPVGEGDSVSFVPLFGIGLKVALMRESIAMPAISATIQYTASSQFSLEDDQSETYAEFTMRVFSLRADVSKNLFIVTPYAGLGFNYNSLDAEIWYQQGMNTQHGDYSVSPSVFKFYAGLNKEIFFFGLNLEGGMSGDSFYGALGISAGM